MIIYDKIVSIEKLTNDNTIDIEVSGNHLFYANGILTHNSNSDIELTDTSESIALPATLDLFLALIRTEELDELDQIMVKQLKNRYSDPSSYKRFVVGVDWSKMKLYDVEQSAQTGITDSGQDDDKPLFEKSKFGSRMKEEKYGGGGFNF